MKSYCCATAGPNPAAAIRADTRRRSRWRSLPCSASFRRRWRSVARTTNASPASSSAAFSACSPKMSSCCQQSLDPTGGCRHGSAARSFRRRGAGSVDGDGRRHALRLRPHLPLRRPLLRRRRKESELQLLRRDAVADWSAVEPSIFGTLLMRALTPEERYRLGAEYTPNAFIGRLVRPTVEEPVRERGTVVQAEAMPLRERGRAVDRKAAEVRRRVQGAAACAGGTRRRVHAGPCSFAPGLEGRSVGVGVWRVAHRRAGGAGGGRVRIGVVRGVGLHGRGDGLFEPDRESAGGERAVTLLRRSWWRSRSVAISARPPASSSRARTGSSTGRPGKTNSHRSLGPPPMRNASRTACRLLPNPRPGDAPPPTPPDRSPPDPPPSPRAAR